MTLWKQLISTPRLIYMSATSDGRWRLASFHRVSILDRQGLPLSWTWSVAAVGLQGKHVQRSAAAKRKVSPARFTAYVNPETNAAIPTRCRSTWMTRTKRTASRRSMKLWMLIVLLIENDCIKQRSFIAFIIVIWFHLCNHSNQKVLCTAC